MSVRDRGVGLNLLTAILLTLASSVGMAQDGRPNILFAIADDWSWPHAGAYGDPVVQTPTFDRLAREGALFEHAFVSSPSCTPSRGAILSGQWHWRLDTAANLWSVFPDSIATYPELLVRAGYDTGVTGKGWGPGQPETKTRSLGGKRFPNFQAFIRQRDESKPFCFWLGSSDPHRPYRLGSGREAGMDLDRIELSGCFPNAEPVRSDVADYYWEVQRFDQLVGAAVKTLEEIGQLDNTIILMTSDNGMPFPRCKSNLYDGGTRMPLAVRWGRELRPGRIINDFVSFTDFAPTFLEAAGVEPPAEMTGRSLLDVFRSDLSGQVDPTRDCTLIGKERHCPAQEQPSMGGYPCRAIRTHGHLYIRNFDPSRWPAGTPDYSKATFPGAWLGDCDNGPTKSYMVEHHDRNDEMRRLYDLAFGKRPAEELYDLERDPQQLRNLADDPQYDAVRRELAERLTDVLRKTSDPRVVGGGEKFDQYPYLGGAPTHPDFQK